MPAEAVVTELTIDSSGAEQGAAAFTDAMAKAQKASNDNLKTIADNTAAINKQMVGMSDAASAAAENSGSSFASFATKLAIGAAAAALGFGAIYTTLKIVYELVMAVPRALGEAWDLGNAKLAEYVALGEKAASSGLSSDFFQRTTKAATDAKLPVDDLTKAFEKLNAQANSDQLGGTQGTNRLSELVKAGNFKGNTGVGELANASTTEDKFRAISSLIDQAMQKGERLAALDVAKTFLGDAVAANLAKDSEYLDKMLASAARVSATDLVPDSAVANAIDLENRYDAAVKILSERWHPIQDILTAGGMQMKEIWVDIVEAIAHAFDWLVKMADYLSGRLYQGARDFLSVLATGYKEAQGPAYIDPAAQMTDARSRLAVGLQNPATVNQARDNTNFIQNTLKNSAWSDKSKNPGNDNAPDTSAYDRAEESLRKYIETSDAAAKSIDLTTAAQERAKAVAQLTAAGMKDGLTREAANAKAEMSGLADAAGQAADALAKARVGSQIKFGSQTSLLSQGDVAIAQQLKGLYPDVATALGSVEAQAIRVNSAMKEVSSSVESSLVSGLADITTGAKSAGQGFTDMSNMIIKAIEQMIIKITIVEPLMHSLQMAASSIGGGFFGGSAPATSGVDGLAAIHHTGGIVGGDAMPTRSVHSSLFAGAPRFHTGGIAGDEVPIIARRGEGVFTQGQMAALGGGGASAPNIVINNHTDAQPQVSRGSNGDVTITLKKMVDSAVGDSLSTGTGKRVLKSQYGVNQFAGQ